jgi:hypothetical protein
VINTYSFSRGPHHVRSVGRSRRTKNGTRWRRRASPYDQVCPRSRRAIRQSPRYHIQVKRGRRPSWRYRHNLQRPSPRTATPGRPSGPRTGRRRAGLSRRSMRRAPAWKSTFRVRLHDGVEVPRHRRGTSTQTRTAYPGGAFPPPKGASSASSRSSTLARSRTDPSKATFKRATCAGRRRRVHSRHA